MNFLIFSAQYLPHMGGIENYTYNVSKQLLSMGHDVTIVTNNTTMSSSFEYVEGIQICRFNCLNFINGRFPIYKKDKIFYEVFSKLEQKKYDLIIVNARFYFHSILAVKYAKKNKIPSIVIDHGTSHLTVHNHLLDMLGARFEHGLTNYLKRYCNDFYAVSKASSQWLYHFGITSKGEIYNAIDLDKINQIKSIPYNPKFREMYGIPFDAKVFTFTGRLLKEKGIIQLIESIKRINSIRDDKVYLFIAGDGELKEYLETEKSNNVIPLGRLTFDDIIRLLSESNYFCLPSDSEGFSTSLLEAAACNNYIITTNRGGAKELLLDDTYGIVIDKNDTDTVYQAINQAINIPDSTLDKSVMKTYTRLKQNFTWNITVKKILSLVK